MTLRRALSSVSKPKLVCALAVLSSLVCVAPASAQDLAGIVARAREQVDAGKYQEALRITAALKNRNLPPALALEVGLLETNALLVTQGAEEATKACGRAVIAADFDPEVARDQSPKVREVCRAAAKEVRAGRLGAEKIEISKLDIKPPDVAFQPLRASTEVSKKPTWLKVVARVQSTGLEGSFDVPLIPSEEGPLRGMLDPSWIRPGATLKVALVAQDKFGDLGPPSAESTIKVPNAEAAIVLGSVPKGAKITLDGDAVTPDASGKLPTSPGKHEVAMTLEDGAYAETEVELRRGGITRVALAPQAPSPSRAWPWVATGTSVALLVAGGVLLINAESRRSELEDAAARREPGTDLPASDYATLQDIDDERVIFQNVGIGLMAGGGAMAIVATVLWLVPTGGSTSTASISPVIGPTYWGVRGSF